MVNDLSDTLYEALMDEDIASVVETATKLDYVIKDLIQTFSDEI
tara:strand:+ start:2909 stop:3040 length:132 start_codon:yes stop_codon:yes gene_type:complete